jgi:hypothetical protein
MVRCASVTYALAHPNAASQTQELAKYKYRGNKMADG